MVSKLLRPGRNGVSDWLIQRVSAVVIALYVVFLLGVFLFAGNIDYPFWKQFFSNTFVQVFTLLTLVSLLLHAWVGIWTVLTDYIGCACLRLFLQVLLVGSLFFYLIWGIKILWGCTL